MVRKSVKSKDIAERFFSVFSGKQKDVADYIGVKQPIVSQWKTGKSSAQTHAAKLSELVGCDLHWLLTGEGVPFPDKNIVESNVSLEMKPLSPAILRVVGYTAADNLGGRINMEAINDVEVIPEGRYLIEVIGSSMEPIAHEGQRLIIVSREPQRGDLAVVTYRDGNEERTLAKRWTRLNGTVLLTSISDPPVHEPISIKTDSIISTFVIVGVLFE